MDNFKKIEERKSKLRRRIAELTGAVELDLAFVFERFFDTRAYSYATLEEELQNFENLFVKIEAQVDDAIDLSDLTRTAERLAYVEDRLDELESRLYNRPRRKGRHRFSFSDFFSQFSQRNGEAPLGEVSVSEAYRILSLEEGSGLLEVTAAFRRFAKQYHPDARGGDRSAESQLRKVVEAYQFLKQRLSESGGV
jgi:hypothetical protein